MGRWLWRRQRCACGVKGMRVACVCVCLNLGQGVCRDGSSLRRKCILQQLWAPLRASGEPLL